MKIVVKKPLSINLFDFMIKSNDVGKKRIDCQIILQVDNDGFC